jgi:hypothetical protein
MSWDGHQHTERDEGHLNCETEKWLVKKWVREVMRMAESGRNDVPVSRNSDQGVD